FYRALAERSDRVAVETIGRSHGGREHILVYVARPERLAKLDDLRAGRVRASRAGEGPPVVWLGYSVHGNEASGASAAAIVAWHLATSDDEEVRRILDQLIIVMEPVINPDGVDRFAHWVNANRGRNPSPDPNDREHNETWPNGRTSYYWFDLNRDWMPLTHPVSRQRIHHYRQWRPHVVTDAHEMGHRASYFFQPGIPERNNPATPERVFELTTRIAEFHGRALDRAGEPYYARESFDDYYLGKGSTYPDLTGGVGILFEQGSSRGHRMDTPWGERSFADGVANQVRTSFSTLEGSVALADELLAHQRTFFAEARELGARGGWLLGDDGDPERARRLLELLTHHGIEVRPVRATVTIGEREFEPGSAWAIPGAQDQYRFIRALFDTPTELPMETFYDVSAWPLQHAFDLPLAEVGRLPATGDPLTVETMPRAQVSEVDADAVAWTIDWRQHNAPALLAALLSRGYRVQTFEKPVILRGRAGPVNLSRGSVLVHSGIQPDTLAPAHQTLTELAGRHRVTVSSIDSGLARDGVDLGSPSAPLLDAPRPLLLAGDTVSGYGAGQVWRWFDLHLDQPVARVAPDELPANLSDYSHIILPPGRYGAPENSLAERLGGFVRGGGALIAFGSAAEWVESLDLDWDFVESGNSEDDTESPHAAYEDHELDYARTLIGGSALNVALDPSHPLAWGYERDRITLFRQGSHALQRSANRYATPGRYAEQPLIAGYLSASTAVNIAGTPAVAANRIGQGVVVRIADLPLFRGYWAGAERLMANAVFYSQVIGATRMPD
ncbi:MAG: M14 family zinc carboxypeptidase, partial [Wenzhouxiangellaceae bacterium]